MAEPTFEKSLDKLEKIVAELEDGDLALDDALKKYEEGVKLARLCTKKLDTAQKKVEILLKSTKGNIELAPFDEGKILDQE